MLNKYYLFSLLSYYHCHYYWTPEFKSGWWVSISYWNKSGLLNEALKVLQILIIISLSGLLTFLLQHCVLATQNCRPSTAFVRPWLEPYPPPAWPHPSAPPPSTAGSPEESLASSSSSPPLPPDLSSKHPSGLSSRQKYSPHPGCTTHTSTWYHLLHSTRVSCLPRHFPCQRARSSRTDTTTSSGFYTQPLTRCWAQPGNTWTFWIQWNQVEFY